MRISAALKSHHCLAAFSVRCPNRVFGRDTSFDFFLTTLAIFSLQDPEKEPSIPLAVLLSLRPALQHAVRFGPVSFRTCVFSLSLLSRSSFFRIQIYHIKHTHILFTHPTNVQWCRWYFLSVRRQLFLSSSFVCRRPCLARGLQRRC
jgi:hypothetical protein